MNNVKKIGLSALAGSLVAMSATAGEMAVSGSASVTVGNSSEGNNGTYHTMSDSINFNGSGELDNGMTVSMAVEFDGDEGDAGEGLDGHSITLDTNGMGVIKFVGHGGAGVLASMDDKMPTAYEEPWDAVAGADADIIDGINDDDAVGYTSPTVSGFTFMASYVGGSGDSDSGTSTNVAHAAHVDYGVTYSPEMVDGLNLGYATGTNEKADAGVEEDQMTAYATYSTGPVTVGAQISDLDSDTASADIESEGYGISYAITEDFSVSYGVHTIEYEDTSKSDQESTGIGFSYTMGSISVGGTMNEVDNVAGAPATDLEGYEFNLSMAF